MATCFSEPAEQLGDTTPGAFDTLPPLEPHPAVLEAREATRLPGGRRAVAVVLGVIALSWLSAAIWPLAYQP